ncbi:MAG TPA: thioredoxin domain-containing protein [Solirubrobacteraceae bacterium]|jgi:protein-disulfide isomerase|nr:thioredoxin domain-containing protein [Solirubrobacteraceae bacterium]
MASRKQQKEEARQRRLEQERARTAQAQRRQRIWMLGGVLAAAVVVVVVAVAISLGGTSSAKAPKPGTPQAKQTFSEVSSLLGGIPQSGTTLGNPNAKVTIDYYGDLECPICRAFTLGLDGGGFPQMVKDLVRTGKVKVVYLSFCTATCTNHSHTLFNQQQVAAYSAGQQKLFWDYADLFYHEQGDETTSYVNTAYLNDLAKQIPSLDLKTWQTDQTDPSLLSQVQGEDSQASKLNLPGTPTLVAIGPTHETLVNGGNFPTYSTILQAVNAVS